MGVLGLLIGSYFQVWLAKNTLNQYCHDTEGSGNAAACVHIQKIYDLVLAVTVSELPNNNY